MIRTMSEWIMSDPNAKAARYHMSVAYKPEGTPNTTAAYYSSWAENNNYEKSVYGGPAMAAQAVADFFANSQVQKVKILDVAAGTGYVGEYLRLYGLENVDALDPSEAMLKIAREKDIYRNIIWAYVDDKELPILDDTYDCVVTSGGLGEGHIPWNGLDQLIRVVKPGGLICLIMREEYLQHSQCDGKLEPYMDKLVQQGSWERLSRVVKPNYCFDLNGIMYTYRVLSGKYKHKKQGTFESGTNL